MFSPPACTAEQLTEAPGVSSVMRISSTIASIQLETTLLSDVEYFQVRLYNSTTGNQRTDLTVYAHIHFVYMGHPKYMHATIMV